jgi:hypothetical protein
MEPFYEQNIMCKTFLAHDGYNSIKAMMDFYKLINLDNPAMRPKTDERVIKNTVSFVHIGSSVNKDNNQLYLEVVTSPICITNNHYFARFRDVNGVTELKKCKLVLLVLIRFFY